jgi:signal transduction histidine kinase
VRHTGSNGDIRLSVIGDRQGTSVRIVVADGGTGIPADQLPLIFDRFRTGDGERAKGTGLGLPLVRAVAHAHGGDVAVRSTHGEGSEFELTLPVPVRSVLPAAPADRTAADRAEASREEDAGSTAR